MPFACIYSSPQWSWMLALSYSTTQASGCISHGSPGMYVFMSA